MSTIDIPVFNTFHPLRTPLNSNILIESNEIELLLNKLKQAFYNLSIDVKINKNGYTCLYFEDLEFIEFEIRFYTYNEKNMFEFKLMCGDRFGYAQLLYKISEILGKEIPGSRNFKSFSDDNYADESFKPAFREMIGFMEETIKTGNHDIMIQGFKTLYSCIDKRNPHIDLLNDLFKYIIDNNFESEFDTQYYHSQLKIIHMVILSKIAEIGKISTTDINKVIDYAFKYIDSENFHLRNQTLLLIINIKKSEYILAKEIYIHIYDNLDKFKDSYHYDIGLSFCKLHTTC